VTLQTGSSLLGKLYHLAVGSFALTVVEVGAGLQRYAHDGVDVTVPFGNDVLPPRGCGATLVPWPNRIDGGRYRFADAEQQLALTEPEAGNAIHGLARWERWAKVRHTDAEVTLRLDVVPQKGYPFPLRTEITYALDPVTGLTVTLRARNTGSAPAPFGAGSHPYLATRGHRLDAATLQIPARRGIESDERGIPTGSHPLSRAEDFRRGRRLGDRRLDNGFTDLVRRDGRGHAEIRTRSGGAQLWFDDAFRYLQVFTLDSVGPDGPPGIAIEPMTCASNAFNSGDGLLVLEPRESWAGSWGISLT
jgi:aldose 1-epimerase